MCSFATASPASIWWAQEVAQLGMLVSYFLGIADVVKANQDIVIGFIVQRLPRVWQRPLYLAIQALVGVFAIVVAAQGVALAPQQLAFKTYILDIPKFYATLPLILASVSMAATAAYFGIAAWMRWRDDPDSSLEALEAELTILRETTGEA